jgi:putative aldouronate transport system permease protein
MLSGRGALAKAISRDKYLYAMLIPVVAWYLVFCYAPMYGIFMSFQKFSYAKGFLRSPFVGLDNFVTLFNDESFIVAFKNTFAINSLRILFGFPVPILFAVLLNEVRHPAFKKAVQTATYIPHFISWVVMAGILNSLLTKDSGTLTALLAALGVERTEFLMDNRYFRAILIVTDVWKEMGWNTIIYLAAISSIDPTLYEAAIVDGAGRPRLVLGITLPCIRSTIIIMGLLMVGNIFSMGFDQVFNLYNGAVFETADIMDTYIVRNLQMNPDFGLLSAAGAVKSVICFATLLLADKLVASAGEQGLFK